MATQTVSVAGTAEVLDSVRFLSYEGEPSVTYLVDDVLYPQTPAKKTYILVNLETGAYLRNDLSHPRWVFAY